MSGREECSTASTFLRRADKKGSGSKELSVPACVAVWCCVMQVECAGVTGKGVPQANADGKLSC